jgi:hypothetical protein
MLLKTGGRRIFHATNRRILGVYFDNGWAQLAFNPSSFSHFLIGGATQHTDLKATPPTITNLASLRFNGLPMVGFAAQRFNNGTLTNNGVNVWSSYTGRMAHRFSKWFGNP